MCNRLVRILGLIGLLAANIAHADPLTFYYDQASWLAATSGLPIDTYSGASTETKTFETVEYPGTRAGGGPPPGVFPVISTSSASSFAPNGGFSDVSTGYPIGFTFPPICSRPSGGAPCVGTGLTGLSISLGTPILGFEGKLFIADSGAARIFLNGQEILPLELGLGDEYAGFFGVIGPISTLAFTCLTGGSTCITDNPVGFRLSDIQVVPEVPSGLLFFSVVCLLLISVGAHRWRSALRGADGTGTL